jgi:phosphoribosylformylglycinamidine synthase
VPTAKVDAVLARARDASVLVSRIGTTGGDVLAVQGERALRVSDLSQRSETWLPAYMAGEA